MQDNFYEHSTQPTLACDFKVKTIELSDEHNTNLSSSWDRGESVKMFIWDTAGQERFRQIARIYYRDTHGILICFDITNEDSFSAC